MSIQIEKILGMNARNLVYIRPHNKKRAIRLADDKLGHKKLLDKHSFPVPKIYKTFETNEDIDSFDWSSLPNSFVIKPARGFGGEGIIVVFGKSKDGWIRTDGSIVDIEQMKLHTHDILDGSYSMHNISDLAFIEQKIITHNVFKKYTHKGTPDIRIIAYNKVPVMAMLRVPTKESDGRANLHAGALGIGIEIATGITTHAVYRNHIITRLPSNKKIKLHGIKIPDWDEMLKMSSQIQELTNLGYIGIDFVLDQKEGPMILEINARPGLSIQNANLSPLRERLERVEGLKITSPGKAVRIAKEIFSGEVNREVEEISGKPIVGYVEKIKIQGPNRKGVEIKTKVDTGAGFSSIERGLAKELGFIRAIKWFDSFDIPTSMTQDKARKLYNKYEDEIVGKKMVERLALVHSSHGSSIRPVVKVKINIGGKNITAYVNISRREHLNYPIIIGRRDMKDFIVDSEKKFVK